MLVLYCSLLGLISAAWLLTGIVLVLEVQSEYCSRLQRLEAAVSTLSPDILPLIEINFRCCGVDKFTDYNDARQGNYTLIRTTSVPFTLRTTPARKTSKTKPRHRPGGPFIIGPKGDDSEEDEQKGKPSKTTAKLSWKDFSHRLLKRKAESSLSVGQDRLSVVRNLPGLSKEEDKNNKKWSFQEMVPAKPIFLLGVPEWLAKQIPQVPPGAKNQNWIVNWKNRLIYNLGRWVFGYSWGKTSEGLNILPYSCCKNLSPDGPCYGDPFDTWQEGCKDKVITFWRLTNMEIGMVLSCLSLPMVFTMFVTYLFKEAVKEKYY